MPSSHRQPPISIRLPENLREWLFDYAARHDRAVRAIITEALEEYRARRGQERSNGMQPMTTAQATDYLRRAFTYNFMRPDEPAWAPIWFPGITYSGDALSVTTKAKGAHHLIEVFRRDGYVIGFDEEIDASAALHHVLWDKWTKDEIGNGRFTGRLFDDQGRIYHGCTATDAARYTVERLTALGGLLCSYTMPG